MDDRSYTLNNLTLTVPVSHVDKLLAMGDGTCALLYLYALRKDGSFTASQAARDLKRTDAEIVSAAERLSQNGLADRRGGEQKPLPAEELPQYRAEEIVATAREDPGFKAVLEETQRLLGKTLSRTDVETLFGIYDHLSLPPEVIVLLINHCLETARQRLGPGRLPSMRAIEKEAYIWHNREILTLEQADAYLLEKRRRNDQMSEIKNCLQIKDRSLSPTERSYVESWLDMGFDSEAIAHAYDRTVIQTGRLQWKYMNAVLESWHGKGLHSLAEIEEGDRKTANPAPSPGPRTAARTGSKPGGDDAERLKRLLRK